MRIKLGVIFGGESVEHEVSVISALQAISNIDENKYEVIPIYITKDRVWYTGESLFDINNFRNIPELLKSLKMVSLVNMGGVYSLQSINSLFRKELNTVDVVLPVVHGNNVEDGSLAGYLETIGVPYVGSHILGAALGQDKVVMKQVMKSEGILVVDYVWFYENEYIENKDDVLKSINKLKMPWIVKPANLGSSVGITLVKDKTKLEEAINEAIRYDQKIVVEEAVEKLTEVNASVIGNHEYQTVSEIEEVMGEDEFLSYRDKYLGSSKTKGSKSKGMASTSRIIPARITDKQRNEIINMSKKVFKVLNLSGVVRIDYLINNKNGNIYVNEPNTIPGSLSFYLWKATGKSYSELLDDIITLAIKDYKNRRKKTYSFDSNILQNVNGLKGGKGVKK